ncbi:hypothetical protein [Geotalea sp. SG265]|uniref:hypothetical protein n=1 Tax=Geotalea sp. SG265 TaxID=2922867 RepID=UPI001FAE7FB4|nr:hypothetical protein [Geotalea sp. SG265]
MAEKKVDNSRMGRNPLSWIQDTREEEGAGELGKDAAPAAPALEEKPAPVKPVLQQKPVKQVKQNLQSKQSKSAATATPVVKIEADDGVTDRVSTIYKGLPPGYQRQTYILSNELVDKVRNYAWWERMDIKEVMHEALEMYFADKKVKPIPEGRKKG